MITENQDFRFGKITIFNDIELLQKTGKERILSGTKGAETKWKDNKYIFTSNVPSEDLLQKSHGSLETKFYSFVRSGLIIDLPVIQKLFYKLPQIIMMFIKQESSTKEFNPRNTGINLADYVELLIHGVEDNFDGLKRIITIDDADKDIGLLVLELNELIQHQKDRVKLWSGVFERIKRAPTVGVGDLIEFNEEYGGPGGWGTYLSPKEHYGSFNHEVRFARELERYIKALIQHFGGTPEKRIFDPLYHDLPAEARRDKKTVEKPKSARPPVSYSEEEEELIERFKNLEDYNIIGRTPVMLEVYKKIKIYGPSHMGILLLGGERYWKRFICAGNSQIFW